LSILFSKCFAKSKLIILHTLLIRRVHTGFLVSLRFNFTSPFHIITTIYPDNRWHRLVIP